MNYSEEDLGKFYLYQGDVYEMRAFCRVPSVTMERIKDKHIQHFGVGGIISNEFVKLVPIKECKELSSCD